MTTLYVVRPDQRGIAAYPCHDSVQHPVRGVEHGWAERPLGEPGEGWAAHTCTVRVGTVCAHDWLCTGDLRLAQLVDGLYGATDREREAVVRYLRATDGALDYRACAHAVEVGAHHWGKNTGTSTEEGR